MNIEESNKLIAELMDQVNSPVILFDDEESRKKGLKPTKVDNYSKPSFWDNRFQCTYGFCSYQKPLDMMYHKDWQWLMPVVEKIESLENSEEYEVDIFGNCCDIGGRFEAVGKTKLEATYKAVVNFIQWYKNREV